MEQKIIAVEYAPELVKLCEKISQQQEREPVKSRVRPPKKVVAATEFTSTYKEKEEHDAEPIKHKSDILRVSDYFLQKKQYKNLLIFTIGINWGLRYNEIVNLKAGNLLDEGGNFRDFTVVTLSKAKTKKNGIDLEASAIQRKTRKLYLVEPIMDAADLFFEGKDIDLNEYLFRPNSNNSMGKETPQSLQAFNEVLRKAARDLDFHSRLSTHSMRKTFAYHIIMSAPDRSRAIEFLRRVLGHSSDATTLHYAGITDDEIRETCKKLNLGNFNQEAAYGSGFVFQDDKKQ